MYLFHESLQRHKAPVIRGPRTIQLRSDQTQVKSEIILMLPLYLFEYSFETKRPSEFLVRGAGNLVFLFPGEHFALRNYLMQNK